ncbi:hypothetical protein ACIBEK_24215 [Nocardia fusca]|uniref:hypothetical protein n=1 Tax=Nocardia fusca TaxID=941183 RepID=UPI0037B62E16
MPPAALLAAVVCDDCAHTIPPDQDATLVDGDRMCPDCAADAVYCDECSERTREPRRTALDTQLCADCARTWSKCGDCHLYSRYITAIVGGGEVCDDCRDAYPICDDCDDRCHDTTTVDGGNEVCIGCRVDDYHECVDCLALIQRAEDYCASCALDHPGHDEICSYDYKPTPVFHGRGPLFLGLELELKTPSRQLFDAAEAALTELGDLGYLKHDSSIDCGFELVTHRHTEVSYSRETTDPLHWYNPDTNQPASLTLGTSAVTENHSILLITAVPRAYCGPTDYLSRLPHPPAAAS